MRNLDKTLIDYCDSIFEEFMSDMFVKLEKKSKDYQTLKNKEEKLLNKYPDLRNIIEDRESMDLTKEEVSALINILGIMDDIRMIEEKELFVNGMKECCNVLKKLELLKL